MAISLIFKQQEKICPLKISSMKIEPQDDLNSTKKVSSFARRSYKIYLDHYKSRNLTPALNMDEFLENYS